MSLLGFYTIALSIAFIPAFAWIDWRNGRPGGQKYTYLFIVLFALSLLPIVKDNWYVLPIAITINVWLNAPRDFLGGSLDPRNTSQHLGNLARNSIPSLVLLAFPSWLGLYGFVAFAVYATYLSYDYAGDIIHAEQFPGMEHTDTLPRLDAMRGCGLGIVMAWCLIGYYFL